MLRIGKMIVMLACLSITGLAQTNADASASAQPVHVSNEVMLGLVDRKTMPVYPDEAMKKGIQGDVVLKIDVDETGKIIGSVPVKGDPLLIDASKNALRTFHFRPYLLDGTPVKVKSQLGFHFSTEKTTDGVSGHVECMASIPRS